MRKMINSSMIRSLCLITSVLMFGCLFVHLLVSYLYDLCDRFYMFNMICIHDLSVMFVGFISHVYRIDDIFTRFIDHVCKVMLGGKHICYLVTIYFVYVVMSYLL